MQRTGRKRTGGRASASPYLRTPEQIGESTDEEGGVFPCQMSGCTLVATNWRTFRNHTQGHIKKSVAPLACPWRGCPQGHVLEHEKQAMVTHLAQHVRQFIRAMDVRHGTQWELAYLVGRNEEGGLPRYPAVPITAAAAVTSAAIAPATPPPAPPAWSSTARGTVMRPTQPVSGRSALHRLHAALAQPVDRTSLYAANVPTCRICTGTLSLPGNQLVLCDACALPCHENCTFPSLTAAAHHWLCPGCDGSGLLPQVSPPAAAQPVMS